MTKIKQDPKNYRIHGDKNKKLIHKSLSEYGAGRSILLDKNDCIIAGNGVFEQAEKLGLPVRIIESDGKELVAIKRTDIDSDDKKRQGLAIADNKTSDTSLFDIDLLNADFNIDDLLDLGFEPAELHIQEMDIPEDLTAAPKNNPPVIKITFPDMKSLERFEKELKPLTEKHQIEYVVTCGEI